MRPSPRIARILLLGLALAGPLWGCQSTPSGKVSVAPGSSLLAVDVLFPFPFSRDPALVQAFFVKGPIHHGLEELQEVIPATFVKRDRAYLLDPEPGTYSLVAVSSLPAPPWNDVPIAGVNRTVWNGEIGHLVVFPAELIHKTRTTIGASGVSFMGAVRIQRGDRINANSAFQDDLQKRLAERIRPGVTSRSGLGGRFTMTWMVDLSGTQLRRQNSDRDDFYQNALADLGDSPWSQVVARVAPVEVVEARERATASRSTRGAATSAAPVAPLAVAESVRSEIAEPKTELADLVVAPPVAAEPRPSASATATPTPSPTPIADAAATPPQVASVDPGLATPRYEPPPPRPKRRSFKGLPSGSPLAKVQFGMRHDEVLEILGDPDDKTNRLTAKAWIPFYTGPGAELVDWTYDDVGTVIFSLHAGSLEVVDVVDTTHEPK